ncbi:MULTISPECIES: SDR family NAD(P)-dependent oxidoreductase [Psychrobacter]|jgi:short-subunit dehydrogenase|uniref:SDR family NAD(P)-dependent oxidoreductase n=1 Tax=Psychrobacter TaxID=497 RepID=UPI000ACB16C2|nr:MULTISPECIES: SDR family NAD(P)-dependent oxidoreductase [Psychrobacter]MBA6244269.1 SDR family NAD(P)-dependent oxidoreductase [Psychrobacter sp. Urea-trap-18]MBA6286597.1 SDR family NAD(P)-dependent oxidoreductase [Psychrobacter sp. Urea-trap-16]MBA6317594.1 SDR family NAD(P)-dependent oxidoreductase [Psychrobacter sp. Urea-trap-20]MBA6334298.1 SDR family NAD(P)-dependent oxidoreductase [Psychrobacter sp. Urea-trap-19]PKG60559.1 short-chain dehydrogenase [Psychrobacter sp. Choline-3u-12]|tara:strand:- start:117 stop:1103 length:987 start_codon:yes stop_codon:yes gene_type:complete
MLNHVTAMATSLRQHLPFSSNHASLDDSDVESYYRNHVAAITGAGSGMGRELAVHLAKMGCHVALSDINPEQLAATKQLLTNYDVNVTMTVLDVSDHKAVESWADSVMSDHGKVNFIFNNAGVALYSTVEGSSISELEWVMNINFWGVVYGTKAFLPLIKNSVKQSQFGEHGHIINISSLFGLTAQPSQSAYNSSKFAVRGFTESLRQELNIQNCGVSATCIHPGGIKTNIANSARGNESIHDIGMSTGPKTIRSFNKFLKFDANEAAWIILYAAATNQQRCLIGNDAKMIDAIQRVFPSHYSQVLNDFHQLSRKLKPRRHKKLKTVK